MALRLPLKTLAVTPARSSYPSFRGKTVLHFPNQQPHLSTPSLRFSTYATSKLQHEQESPPKKDGKASGPKAETPLAMSFEAMGVGKNLRLFIIVMLSVSATIETLTYGREIWIWWRGDKSDPV